MTQMYPEGQAHRKRRDTSEDGLVWIDRDEVSVEVQDFTDVEVARNTFVIQAKELRHAD